MAKPRVPASPVGGGEVGEAPQRDEPTDDQLVLDARDGNVRAFERLLDRHEGRVLRVLRLLGIPPQEREDVAQEVFVRVFRHLGGFRTGRPFTAWLYRISVNACHDYRKKDQRRHREETAWEPSHDQVADPGPAPSERLEQEAGLDRLDDALRSLTERERAVFVLCCIEELETKEVAKTLGITRITVRRHLGRARARLQSVLTEKKSGSD